MSKLNNSVEGVAALTLQNTSDNSLSHLPASTPIKLTESFPVKILKALLKYDDVLDEDKTLLRKYLRASDNGEKITIFKPTYHKYGRLYADKSLSLQCFSKRVRHTLAKDLYYDIDIKNAHPVILEQLCNKLKYKCPKLKKYIQNRESYLQDIIDLCNVNRDSAKTLFLIIMYGGSLEKWKKENGLKAKLPSFVRSFKTELKK